MTGLQHSGGPGPKPEWLKKPIPDGAALHRMDRLLRGHHLHTICESALCPNLGECFAQGTATFLIMGNVCTRNCRFCGVSNGSPEALDPREPGRVADAVATLGLRHVVITSVTRDDLLDGGAGHFASTIRAVRAADGSVGIEVLVPDFGGDFAALDTVLSECPEVFNHNVETVPRLYATVRPGAVFERSAEVLRRAAETGSSIVKTGWMVGLGETIDEVEALLTRMAEIGVGIVTIGQYLRPSKTHLPVVEYVSPAVFSGFEAYGRSLGLRVCAAPFVRSSFRAGETFLRAGGHAGPAS